MNNTDNENNINDKNNISAFNQLSLSKDKEQLKTIGIPSDIQTKEVFDNIFPGYENHQKLVLLLKTFEEKVTREKKLAFIDNVDLINKCIDTIATQVEAISKGLVTEEARMRSIYIDDTRAELEKFMNDWDTIVKLNEDNEKLAYNNEKLNKVIDNLQADIVNLNKKIDDLNKIKNDLVSENNELLKKQNNYNVDINNIKNLYESKIDGFISKISELKGKISVTSAKLSQFEEENKKLDVKINDLNEQHKVETESLINKIQEEKIYSVKKDSIISNLEKELEINRDSLSKLDENISNLKEDMKILTKENDSYKDYAKELEFKLNDFNKVIIDLNEKESKLKSTIEANCSEILNLNKENKILVSETEKMTLDLKSVTLEIESLKKENNLLYERLNELNPILNETKNKLIDEEKKGFKLELEFNLLKEKYNKLFNSKKNDFSQDK